MDSPAPTHTGDAGRHSSRGIDAYLLACDVSPDPVVLVDARGIVLRANAPAAALVGAAADRLAGKPADTLIAAADRERFHQALERLREAQGAVAASPCQVSLVRADGSLLPVDLGITALDGGDALFCRLVDVADRLSLEARLRACEERLQTLPGRTITQVEEELRASQRFIEAVARASPPWIYVFDVERDRLTYVNRDILRELGYPLSVFAVDGLESWKAYLPPEEASHLDRVVRAWHALPDGQLREDEYRVRDRDGGERWLLGRETVFSRRADGRVHQVLGTLNDITTRKQAEQSLAASRALLQSFVEHTPAAVAMLDRNLRYLAVSRRWLQDYDIGERDLTGQHHYDVFPEIRQMAEWRRLHERVLAGAVESREEDPFVRADGHVDWLRWEMRPWRDGQGAIGGLIMFTEVITRRKLIEAQLRESQRHLLASQHVARVGSWEFDLVSLTDLDANPLRWSDECFRVFGYQPRAVEVCAAAFWRRVHPDDRSHLAAAMHEAIATGSTRALDHRLVLDDGTERVVHEQVELVRDTTSGTPAKLIGAVQDITDRLRLEEQLRQSQKMQAVGQLAGGIAHDFNNLLTLINGHADMLLDRLEPGDPLREDLTPIRDAGEQAALLTRQLLLFSRKAVVEPRILDCGVLIAHTTRLLRRLMSDDVTLSTALAPALHLIKADPSQIEQVLMNLSLNARDAMPHGGRLTIAAANVAFDAAFCAEHPEYAVGTFVRLAVSDTGTGLTPQVRAHLFEPFFTTKEPGRGTGLGLATVYGIVQASGGFITVASEAGKGTTFNVFLPALDAGAAVAGADVAGRGLLHGSETVLLVEDHPGVRGIARRALEKYGYRVLEAANGAGAVALSGEYAGPIDILVSDVVMPGLSGRRLADLLLAERPRCRVLFMSGHNEEIVPGKRPHEGFIQKPFSPSGLVARVREVLDRPD